MLRQLKAAGFEVGCFGYFTSVESFSCIAERLAQRIAEIAAQGDDRTFVGRRFDSSRREFAARNRALAGACISARFAHPRLPACATLRPESCVSPVDRRLRRADRFGAKDVAARPHRPAYDRYCRRSRRDLEAFAGELNDGVVSLSEVSAEWLVDQVKAPVAHTLLPASKQVAGIILERWRQAHAHADGA